MERTGNNKLCNLVKNNFNETSRFNGHSGLLYENLHVVAVSHNDPGYWKKSYPIDTIQGIRADGVCVK